MVSAGKKKVAILSPSLKSKEHHLNMGLEMAGSVLILPAQ